MHQMISVSKVLIPRGVWRTAKSQTDFVCRWADIASSPRHSDDHRTDLATCTQPDPRHTHTTKYTDGMYQTALISTSIAVSLNCYYLMLTTSWVQNGDTMTVASIFHQYPRQYSKILSPALSGSGRAYNSAHMGRTCVGRHMANINQIKCNIYIAPFILSCHSTQRQATSRGPIFKRS